MHSAHTERYTREWKRICKGPRDGNQTYVTGSAIALYVEAPSALIPKFVFISYIIQHKHVIGFSPH